MAKGRTTPRTDCMALHERCQRLRVRGAGAKMPFAFPTRQTEGEAL